MSVITTGGSARLTIDLSGVATFSSPPECSVAATTGNQLTNKAAADNIRTNVYFTDFNSLDGGDFTFSTSGAGSFAFFNGTYDAAIASDALLRSGFATAQTTATAGVNIFVQSSNKTWNPKNVKSMTFGFIPLGNGTLAVNGIDAGNLNQAFGLADGTSATDAQATSVIWRLSSSSAAIPDWTLVENNVVKETLSGANLTGNLANKFCRASIVFTNNGANYYGVFTNLTDGATYTTATYATSTPNTMCQIYLHSGTVNATAKAISFDYLLVENNCPPVGGTTSVATSR